MKNTTKRQRMVLLLDPATGGTVLVPYTHPLAIAKRERNKLGQKITPESAGYFCSDESSEAP